MFGADPAGRRSTAAGSSAAETEVDVPAGRVRGFVPALVLFGVFFLVPLGLIVSYSFWQIVDYNVVHDWTLDNYRYFFSVATYVRTMWATIWVSFAATALTIAIAFPFAYWLVALRAASAAEGAARPRDPAVLDELPAARLLVAEHPRRAGAINRFLQWTGATSTSRSRSSSTTGRR